ncbi:MAG: acVLRF1 family peptidyl-tRNA hydrolase [Streptosporangiaceae bacterium]
MSRRSGVRVSTRPAAGGGRWLDIAPERFERWLRGFDDRHHVVLTMYESGIVRFEAADAAVAECHPPFPPLACPAGGRGARAGPLVDHILRRRTVGVLLARLGGHAIGVFEGSQLVASKVGSRYVHGRNQAGGQSQARFQRRRDQQARQATAAAQQTVVRVMVPYADRLDAVVLGGDRRAVAAVLDDPRLRPLAALAADRFLTVPDPKRAILERTPTQFRAVRVRLLEAGV